MLVGVCSLQNGTSVINRKGTMFLKFMPAIGARKYDYQKKEVISLFAQI